MPVKYLITDDVLQHKVQNTLDNKISSKYNGPRVKFKQNGSHHTPCIIQSDKEQNKKYFTKPRFFFSAFPSPWLQFQQRSSNSPSSLKCHYDENRIFSINAILKHKQVACTRRKMPFTISKYLFLFQRYSSF